MDKFLETYNFPKLNQKESENLNKQFTPSETEAVIFKKCPQNKALDGMASQVNFTNFLRRTNTLLKLFHKIQEEGRLPNSFYEASIILIQKPDKDTTKKIISQYPW